MYPSLSCQPRTGKWGRCIGADVTTGSRSRLLKCYGAVAGLGNTAPCTPYLESSLVLALGAVFFRNFERCLYGHSQLSLTTIQPVQAAEMLPAWKVAGSTSGEPGTGTKITARRTQWRWGCGLTACRTLEWGRSFCQSLRRGQKSNRTKGNVCAAHVLYGWITT